MVTLLIMLQDKWLDLPRMTGHHVTQALSRHWQPGMLMSTGGQ